jgi:hypothetical protein
MRRTVLALVNAANKRSAAVRLPATSLVLMAAALCVGQACVSARAEDYPDFNLTPEQEQRWLDDYFRGFDENVDLWAAERELKSARRGLETTHQDRADGWNFDRTEEEFQQRVQRAQERIERAEREVQRQKDIANMGSRAQADTGRFQIDANRQQTGARPAANRDTVGGGAAEGGRTQAIRAEDVAPRNGMSREEIQARIEHLEAGDHRQRQADANQYVRDLEGERRQLQDQLLREETNALGNPDYDRRQIRNLESRIEQNATDLVDAREAKANADTFSRNIDETLERHRDALEGRRSSPYDDDGTGLDNANRSTDGGSSGNGPDRRGSSGAEPADVDGPRSPSPERPSAGEARTPAADSDLPRGSDGVGRGGDLPDRSPRGGDLPEGPNGRGGSLVDDVLDGAGNALETTKRVGRTTLGVGLAVLAGAETYQAGARSMDRMDREQLIREGESVLGDKRQEAIDELHRVLPELDNHSFDDASRLTDEEKQLVRDLGELKLHPDTDAARDLERALGRIDAVDGLEKDLHANRDAWIDQRRSDGLMSWINPFKGDRESEAVYKDVIDNLEQIHQLEVGPALNPGAAPQTATTQPAGSGSPATPADGVDGALRQLVADPNVRGQFPADWTDEQVLAYLRDNLKRGPHADEKPAETQEVASAQEPVEEETPPQPPVKRDPPQEPVEDRPEEEVPNLDNLTAPEGEQDPEEYDVLGSFLEQLDQPPAEEPSPEETTEEEAPEEEGDEEDFAAGNPEYASGSVPGSYEVQGFYAAGAQNAGSPQIDTSAIERAQQLEAQAAQNVGPDYDEARRLEGELAAIEAEQARQQAEADRLAWEEYERQYAQWEADMAAWQAEQDRLAYEQELAAWQAEQDRLAYEQELANWQAEQDRLAWEDYQQRYAQWEADMAAWQAEQDRLAYEQELAAQQYYYQQTYEEPQYYYSGGGHQSGGVIMDAPQ